MSNALWDEDLSSTVLKLSIASEIITNKTITEIVAIRAKPLSLSLNV